MVAKTGKGVTALAAGAVVLVFPGGDYDVYRPIAPEKVIDFGGRTGYVTTAIEANVPIVPVVSIGGQETQLFLTRAGGWPTGLGSVRWRASCFAPTSCP